MTIYTMGFTQKNAKKFFGLIKENAIKLLIDIRLNTVSQLAGFTKGEDLKYFLDEICNCEYVHDLVFAPSKELMDEYKSGKIDSKEFEFQFKQLMKERNGIEYFVRNYTSHDKLCLLCSEPAADKCHRGLVAEMIKEDKPEVAIVHL